MPQSNIFFREFSLLLGVIGVWAFSVHSHRRIARFPEDKLRAPEIIVRLFGGNMTANGLHARALYMQICSLIWAPIFALSILDIIPQSIAASVCTGSGLLIFMVLYLVQRRTAGRSG